MFFLLGGNDKKGRKKEETKTDRVTERVKELFLTGKFPVVTTHKVEGRQIAKVLGLVCCRGYDSEEAFFGMASRAVSKGAHAIMGYCENVAFHPDGSKYFSCFGTAVMFEWEQEEKFGAAALRQLHMEPRTPDISGEQLLREAPLLREPQPLREPQQPLREAEPRESSLASMHGRSVSQMLDDDIRMDPPAEPRRQWRSQ